MVVVLVVLGVLIGGAVVLRLDRQLPDAVTGRSSPLLLAVSVAFGSVGVLGLLLDARGAVKR